MLGFNAQKWITEQKVIRYFNVHLYHVENHPQDEIWCFRDTSKWIQQIFFLYFSCIFFTSGCKAQKRITVLKSHSWSIILKLNCIERNFTMKMKSATLGTPEYQFRRCFSCQSLILGLSDKFQCSKTNHRAKSLLVIRCFSVLLYQVKFHPQDEIRRFRNTSIWIQQVFFLP